MKSKMRIFAVLLAAVLILSLASGAAMAAEKKGSPFKEMCLKLMGLTKKTVEKEVNTVGTTIKKTTDVVVEEVEDVGRLATGDGSKARDVLEKPVKGITAVGGEAAYGVINAPIEAAQEVK
jgi:hypothetical protein